MNTEVSNDLKRMVEKISNNFSVKEIILFGSFAYGVPKASSDIDLCIIMDLKNKKKLQIMREIRDCLNSIINVPVDLLIYSEKEFNERSSSVTTLEYKIKNEGIVLYVV